jgi:ribosomal protein S4E
MTSRDADVLRNPTLLCSATPTPPTMTNELSDGMPCLVIGGTHAGKSGIVRDINTSKTGHVTITVVQANGVRLKTLAKHVLRQADEA